MVDIMTYRKMHGWKPMRGSMHRNGCCGSDNEKFDTWPREIDIDATVEDSVLACLPYDIPGFEMQTKKWGICSSNSSFVT